MATSEVHTKKNLIFMIENKCNEVIQHAQSLRENFNPSFKLGFLSPRMSDNWIYSLEIYNGELIKQRNNIEQL